ncbi:hypothetical protein diail_821 [Diaporthe ilicicola]|nr:hypothetical protein diail_821 [Diaporthe ilicicola]
MSRDLQTDPFSKMSCKDTVEHAKLAPPASPVAYGSFHHWYQATHHSHMMGQNQAGGHYLRQLSKNNPPSPTPNPHEVAEKHPQVVYQPKRDLITFRLVRNKPAIHAMRLSRKKRHRVNIKLLSKDFRLADENATKERAKKAAAAVQAKNLDKADKVAQKGLAAKKSETMTVKEMKYIADMKAAEKKAAAQERLKKAKARAKEQEAAACQSAKAREVRGRMERKYEAAKKPAPKELSAEEAAKKREVQERIAKRKNMHIAPEEPAAKKAKPAEKPAEKKSAEKKKPAEKKPEPEHKKPSWLVCIDEIEAATKSKK